MKKGTNVIVTTKHRGVFYGVLQSYDAASRVAVLRDCVMAIRWRTTRGLFELAADGPNESSKLSARCPVFRAEDVTALLEVTPGAVKQWAQLTK